MFSLLSKNEGYLILKNYKYIFNFIYFIEPKNNLILQVVGTKTNCLTRFPGIHSLGTDTSLPLGW